MTDGPSSIPPIRGDVPIGPGHITPPDMPEFKQESLSAFQKFLGPTATKEQVQQFLNSWVKSMLAEIKRGEKKWKESMARMRRND